MTCGPLMIELSGLAHRHLGLAGLDINDPGVRGGNGNADAALAALAQKRRVVVGYGGGLGEPVALEERLAHPLLEGAFEVHREGRAAAS